MLRKRIENCCPRVVTALLASIGLAAGASAAPLTPGNVVVYRVGDGAAGLLNTGAKVFIDEYTPAGTLVQSIEMPSTGAGAKLVASGTANSEGLLSVSPNGRWVTIAGYNSTIPAAASLPTSTSATVNRTVGVLDASTGTTAFTLLTDWASAGNPRSATTDDSVNLWLAGSNGGIRYTTAGSTTSAQISTPTALTNYRQVNIFDGQLYATTNSGGTGAVNTASIGTVGTGLPNVTPAAYVTIPGIAPVGTITGSSRYAFFFADLTAVVPGVDTLYIADDGALAFSKYSLVGGNWTLNGTIGIAADGYRGVTGLVVGGNVILHATRRGGAAAAGGGELVTLTDASGYNGAFGGAPAVLATAVANTAYRGVGRIPGGACCVAGGGCTIVFSGAQCNGAFQGQGTTCQPSPCPALDGACCLPGGGCITTDSNGCEFAGGLFQGVGSVCTVNLCVGACCAINGACAVTPLAQCNGDFQGFGTVCNPNPCPVGGACCTPNQVCVNTTQAQCVQGGGTFYPGVPCNQINCDEGACCFPNGNCVITTVPAFCQQNGGTFLAFGTVCVPNPCLQPTDGACCKPDGSCSVLTPAQCQQIGGGFQGFGSACVPNPCPVVVTGACCQPDGSCNLVTGGQGACNGVYLGDNSTCAPDVCKGACCLNDGTCSLTGSGGCNGQFLGLGSVCSPNPCPQPTACCSIQNIGQCTLRLGPCLVGEIAFGGTCTPNPCPQQGACCFPDGTCSLTLQGQCNGQFQGPNTACQPNPCPQPTGACCGPNGGCLVVTQAQCVNNGGQYQGDGTSCQPNPCPGVCCAGSVCLNIGQTACSQVPFSQFKFTFLTCPGTNTQPCCRADFNQNGTVGVQDIFDFLAQWFATSPLCDINGVGGVSVQDIFDFLAAWFAGC